MTFIELSTKKLYNIVYNYSNIVIDHQSCGRKRVNRKWMIIGGVEKNVTSAVSKFKPARSEDTQMANRTSD